MSTPPDRDVPWTFTTQKAINTEIGVMGTVNSRVTVHAQSWFRARDLACALLDCGRDQIALIKT